MFTLGLEVTVFSPNILAVSKVILAPLKPTFYP